MDTCICTAESLCCPPETIAMLFIGYTLIQNKNVVWKKKFFLNNKGSLCYKNSFFLILSAMSSQPITWSNWSGKLKTTPTKPWPWRAKLLLKEAAAAASVAPWYKSLWESTFQQVLTIIHSLPGYSAKVWGVLCSFKCINSKKDRRMSMLLGGKQMPLRLEEKCQLL